MFDGHLTTQIKHNDHSRIIMFERWKYYLYHCPAQYYFLIKHRSQSQRSFLVGKAAHFPLFSIDQFGKRSMCFQLLPSPQPLHQSCGQGFPPGSPFCCLTIPSPPRKKKEDGQNFPCFAFLSYMCYTICNHVTYVYE